MEIDPHRFDGTRTCDLVHGYRLRRQHRGAIRHRADQRQQRALHSRRPHRVALPPTGQSLWVLEGVGLVARCGGEVEVIRVGDRVFIEPGEWHWHGASPDRFMTHLAMLEVDDEGSPAKRGAPVTDEEYAVTPLSRVRVDSARRPDRLSAPSARGADRAAALLAWRRVRRAPGCQARQAAAAARHGARASSRARCGCPGHTRSRSQR